MEDNNQTIQKELVQKNKKYEGIKKFFEINMRIKQDLLKLAPTDKDDFNEKSRIEYTDKLYKSLSYYESEFIHMVQELFGNNSYIIDTIKLHFSKSKNAFLLRDYPSKVIQRLYQEYFSNMTPELVEKVKNEFVGYTVLGGDLEKVINGTKSINELLHVIHSYISNNDKLLRSLPIIEVKNNKEDYQITLYGEETEIAKDLFDKIPDDLDIGWTEIVSMPNKILMMIRDRGHALTIDVDITNENDIGVRYFIPKICNKEMVTALPGVNANSISNNGATGFFATSKEDITSKLIDFIERVPTDKDMLIINREEIEKTIKHEIDEEENEKIRRESRTNFYKRRCKRTSN